MQWLYILHRASNGNKHTTNIYRKPTFTGLYTNWFSNVSPNSKLACLRALLHRAFYLVTDYALFHQEVLSIRSLMISNNFPARVVDTAVRRLLNGIFNKKPTTLTVEKLEIVMKLPFCGNDAINLTRKLTNIVENSYHHIKLQTVFTPIRTMRSLFRVKDVTPFALRSGVVYTYNCAGCGACYVGKTIRHMNVRIAEHGGVSSLTGKPLSRPPYSAIREHCLKCVSFDSSNFRILSNGTTDLDLLIKESIAIKILKSSLNQTLSSFELNLF
jgi:hypothetical protein